MLKKVLVCVVALMAMSLASCFLLQNEYDLIPVKNDGKWGYINPKGMYIINPQFNDADFFYDGLAKVESSEGKTGYINKDGKYEIAAVYKQGAAFSEGLAFVVSEGGHPTCIDKKGNIKFVLQEVERIYAFSEGLALFINKDDKYGFIDKSGKTVINPQFEAAYSFCGGFAAVMQNDKWGFIDKNGKIVINPQFEEVLKFNEGKAAFYDGKKWGFIDTKGTYIINPQFDDAFPFTEGLAMVKQGDKYGFINAKGQLEINPQFEDAAPFKSGLAPISQGKTCGFINKKGQYEINPQFEMVWPFYGNIAPVRNGDKWGFIDKKGKYVVNPQFDQVQINFAQLLYGTNLDYVKSDYYDASEFLNIFFRRDGDTSFDGVNASSTLHDIANHKTYDDLTASSRYCAEQYLRKELTKEISLYKVLFHFNAPIYTEVTTYGTYWWGERYKTGTKKEYDFTTKPAAIEYQFDFRGKAYDKGSAIASAMKLEIEQRQNQKMDAKNDRYVLYQDSGDLSFAIDYSDYSVCLYVGFNKKAFQTFIEAMEDVSDYDYDYDDYD